MTDPDKILEQLRLREAGFTRRKIDHTDRVEATHSADAKKARFVVRRVATGSLPALAAQIAASTGDQADKHAIQDALDRFMAANAEYAKLQLRPPGWLLEWAGGAGNGVLPVLDPVKDPAHKVELAAAWNALLDRVNVATKVGVHKLAVGRPITLMVDPESSQ